MFIPNLIVNLTENEISEHPFVKDGRFCFYRFLIHKIAAIPYSKDTVRTVDCTKINVSRYIMGEWETIATNDGMREDEFSLIVLTHGPKTKDALKDNQIMLEPDAIVMADGTRYPQSLMIL